MTASTEMIPKRFWIFVRTATYGTLDQLDHMDRQQVSLDVHLSLGSVIAPNAHVNLGHVLASLKTNVPFIVGITEVRNDFIFAIS
jgi:hypothetical protein